MDRENISVVNGLPSVRLRTNQGVKSAFTNHAPVQRKPLGSLNYQTPTVNKDTLKGSETGPLKPKSFVSTGPLKAPLKMVVAPPKAKPTNKLNLQHNEKKAMRSQRPLICEPENIVAVVDDGDIEIMHNFADDDEEYDTWFSPSERPSACLRDMLAWRPPITQRCQSPGPGSPTIKMPTFDDGDDDANFDNFPSSHFQFPSLPAIDDDLDLEFLSALQ